MKEKPAGVVERTHTVQMPGDLAESPNCTHPHLPNTQPWQMQPAPWSRHRMCLLHLQRLPFNSAKLWGGFESGKESFYFRDKSGRSNPGSNHPLTKRLEVLVFRDTVESFNVRGCFHKCAQKANGKKDNNNILGEKRCNCRSLEPLSPWRSWHLVPGRWSCFQQRHFPVLPVFLTWLMWQCQPPRLQG